MRRKITNETWEQIKVAYVSGIALRELARRMNIPESTVLYHAMRYGWTKQIKAATQPLPVIQSDTIAPVSAVQPAVSHSIAAILSERKERSKLALSKFTAEAAEAAAKHRNKLSISGKVKDVAGVHKTLWPDQPGAREEIVNLAIVTGAFRPLPVNPQYDAATGEAVSEEKEERRRITQNQSQSPPLPANPAIEKGATIEDHACVTVGEKLDGERRSAARLAYEERCVHWRAYRS
jgi:hypothetical protein